MRLSYLSTISLLTVIFSTLSGGDCAPTNLGKRNRQVRKGDLHSSSDEEPEFKMSKLSSHDSDIGQNFDEIPGNLDVVEAHGVASQDMRELEVEGVGDAERDRLHKLLADAQEGFPNVHNSSMEGMSQLEETYQVYREIIATVVWEILHGFVKGSQDYKQDLHSILDSLNLAIDSRGPLIHNIFQDNYRQLNRLLLHLVDDDHLQDMMDRAFGGLGERLTEFFELASKLIIDSITISLRFRPDSDLKTPEEIVAQLLEFLKNVTERKALDIAKWIWEIISRLPTLNLSGYGERDRISTLRSKISDLVIQLVSTQLSEDQSAMLGSLRVDRHGVWFTNIQGPGRVSRLWDINRHAYMNMTTSCKMKLMDDYFMADLETINSNQATKLGFQAQVLDLLRGVRGADHIEAAEFVSKDLYYMGKWLEALKEQCDEADEPGECAELVKYIVAYQQAVRIFNTTCGIYIDWRDPLADGGNHEEAGGNNQGDANGEVAREPDYSQLLDFPEFGAGRRTKSARNVQY